MRGSMFQHAMSVAQSYRPLRVDLRSPPKARCGRASASYGGDERVHRAQGAPEQAVIVEEHPVFEWILRAASVNRLDGLEAAFEGRHHGGILTDVVDPAGHEARVAASSNDSGRVDFAANTLGTLAPMTHSERINSQDGTVVAWSSGNGDPVVLMHGITESAATWDPIVQRLAPNHHVITMDLRGHGESGTAERYDLEAMAGDVVAVAMAAGLERPKLVGHSLGGAVVTAVGAAFPVESVVNVDQSLQLGAFKDQLSPAEPLLRDPETFPAVISQLFEGMRGQLSDAEFARITVAAPRPRRGSRCVGALLLIIGGGDQRCGRGRTCGVRR